jgi:hypothetical protein
VFAARPAGPGWRPSLPAQQWSQTACGTPLDTERQRARGALERARDLDRQGRPAEAIAVLRAEATRSFVQVDLFQALSRALAATTDDAAAQAEARYWADRATRLLARTAPST